MNRTAEELDGITFKTHSDSIYHIKLEDGRLLVEWREEDGHPNAGSTPYPLSIINGAFKIGGGWTIIDQPSKEYYQIY
jgi:hypothetical protein